MMAKQSPSGSRRSKIWTRKDVRITHIGNPRMVKTSPSEFSAVVQSLTGLKKRQPASTSGYKDCGERGSSKSKVPKHEGQFQLSSILGIHESVLLPNMAQESNKLYDGVNQQEIYEMSTDHNEL